MGARPLTFLDYVANETLIPEEMEQIVFGMAKACREAEVAIVGGETAEMPGVYEELRYRWMYYRHSRKDKIITGEKIKRRYYSWLSTILYMVFIRNYFWLNIQ